VFDTEFGLGHEREDSGAEKGWERRRSAIMAGTPARDVHVGYCSPPPVTVLDPLFALSPLDGRYAHELDELRPLLGEHALMAARWRVEIAWILELDTLEPPLFPRLSDGARAELERWARTFSLDDARAIKARETATAHDVKAVEYVLRERARADPGLAATVPFWHFACTSEDINSAAYALLLGAARREALLPALDALLAWLDRAARDEAGTAMLARTHGQPASPTTLGKEWAVFAARFRHARARLERAPLRAKFSGAVGNYNAHRLVRPDVPWPERTARFLARLGLEAHPLTTQIEPHDGVAEYCDALAAVNTVALDLARDVWGYVALGVFRQRARAGEVGSSTMPHKINPIRFENAEGNLGVANALLRHFADKLPVSRWQRDLSDSTTLRNLPVAFAHSWLAWRMIRRGLEDLVPDRSALSSELDAHPEVLAEAIQTALRAAGDAEAYERLRDLTRGRTTTTAELRALVEGLPLPPELKERLLGLEPAAYLGYAAELARGETGSPPA